MLAGPEGARGREFWLRLAGELPSLNLPVDRPYGRAGSEREQPTRSSSMRMSCLRYIAWPGGNE